MRQPIAQSQFAALTASTGVELGIKARAKAYVAYIDLLRMVELVHRPVTAGTDLAHRFNAGEGW